ncbi:hypothetical protein ADL22_12520 [Streptomyces sp. NRRL F-4489]|nr:hypothetical protein ADL22_12520 [Streptomyces sp. NRRL F-4489]
MQEHGHAYVEQKRHAAWQEAQLHSPYSPKRLALTRICYVVTYGMLALAVVAALIAGGQDGGGARVVLGVGVYTCLLSLPLYLALSLRTGRLIARATALTTLEDPAARSRSAAEYGVRSASQPLYAAVGALGCMVAGLLPWPRLHIRMYQGALFAARYRGLDISCVTDGR